MSETIKEIAKAVSATAEVVKPLVSVPARFLENLLEESTKEFGGLLADRIRVFRLENLRRIAERTKHKLQERELLDAEIPIGFLAPILERAADVDQPELQERWAELIANGAAYEENRQPAFAQTLGNMSAKDAAAFAEVTRSSNEYTLEATERLVALGLLDVQRLTPEVSLFRRQDKLAERLLSVRRNEAGTRKVSGYGWQFARAVGLMR